MLRVKQAADRLSLSESKIYELVSRGEFHHHRMGGAIRFSEEQVQHYLEETKRERGNAPPKRQTPRPRLRHIRV